MDKIVTVPPKKPRKNKCSHPFKRVTWSASHLYQIGAGGYYEVGIFDTTVTCRDCGKELYTIEKEAPLCQSCLAPMASVHEKAGIATCGDTLTDTFLSNIDFKVAEQNHRERLKRYWAWHSAREEAAEAATLRQLEEQGVPISFDQSLGDSMYRIMRGASMLQVWPYTCTSSNCYRQGRLKWLETPGD